MTHDSSRDPSELFFPFGVDADTGTQVSPPWTAADVVRRLRRARVDRQAVSSHVHRTENYLRIEEGRDANLLEEAGWGVIFPHDADPAVRQALLPLLERRKEVAGALYREFAGVKGYRPHEDKPRFLRRHGAPTSGSVEPTRMPYYLLLVGHPEQIPFSFQAQMALQYAVGRLAFDTPDAYGRYAECVLAAERAPRRGRRAVFFGPRHEADPATRLSADILLPGLAAAADAMKSESRLVRGEAATKDALRRLLGGSETPGLLFTAGHGVMSREGGEHEVRQQGALLCQGWSRASRAGGLAPEYVFAGDDLAADSDLTGLVAFLFACHSGGTQRVDSYYRGEFSVPRTTSARSFLAALPTHMLSHPGGACLAVVAHIDRTWTHSFHDEQAQLSTFRGALTSLLRGRPVGLAMQTFGERHGELAARISHLTEEADLGVENTYELAMAWIECNDARNFLVLGDPAVRLSVPGFG